MEFLKIDKNVPVYPENNLGIPALNMERGDSVFIPYEIDKNRIPKNMVEYNIVYMDYNRVKNNINNMIERLDKLHALKFTYAETSIDNQDGFRVWRIG